MYIVRALFKKGIIKVGKTFLSIYHAVVLYNSAMLIPNLQAVFLFFPFKIEKQNDRQNS